MKFTHDDQAQLAVVLVCIAAVFFIWMGLIS